MALEITDRRGQKTCTAATLARYGMDPWVFAPLREATPKDDERERPRRAAK